jgi:Swi5-dependent recombination DNA repair protein 1
MQKKQSEWKQGGFDEPINANAGDDEDEEHDQSEKRDLYAEYDIESDHEAEARIAPEEEDSDVSSVSNYSLCFQFLICSQTFTIDMMLKSINVDLQAIGYDKQQQRWSD